MTAVVIDNGNGEHAKAETLLKNVEFIKSIKAFDDFSKAIRYIKKFPVDFIVAEINNTVCFTRDFYNLLPYPVSLLLTSQKNDHALYAYDINAVDFFLTPYTPDRFTTACKKAYELYTYRLNSKAQKQTHLLVRGGYTLHKIAVEDITYVESIDDYVKIHLSDKKLVTVRASLKSIINKLPEKEFLRIHRSYLIPTRKISYVNNKVIKVDEVELPIGTTYHEQVARQFVA